jgi:hypothetical protein
MTILDRFFDDPCPVWIKNAFAPILHTAKNSALLHACGTTGINKLRDAEQVDDPRVWKHVLYPGERDEPITILDAEVSPTGREIEMPVDHAEFLQFVNGCFLFQQLQLFGYANLPLFDDCVSPLHSPISFELSIERPRINPRLGSSWLKIGVYHDTQTHVYLDCETSKVACITDALKEIVVINSFEVFLTDEIKRLSHLFVDGHAAPNRLATSPLAKALFDFYATRH